MFSEAGKVIILISFFCDVNKGCKTDLYALPQYNNLIMASLRYDKGLVTFLYLGNNEAYREYLYFF